jgi:hypothetical protein
MAPQFLTLALDGSELSASRPSRLTPRCPLYREVGEPQSRYRHCEVERHILSLSGIGSLLFSPGTHRYIDSAVTERAPKLCPKSTCNKERWEYLVAGRTTAEFNNFGDTGSFSSQNAYLFACTKSTPSKRKYVKKRKHADESGRRFFPYTYQVKVNVNNVEVCRRQFLFLHRLSKGHFRNVIITTGT